MTPGLRQRRRPRSALVEIGAVAATQRCSRRRAKDGIAAAFRVWDGAEPGVDDAGRRRATRASPPWSCVPSGGLDRPARRRSSTLAGGTRRDMIAQGAGGDGRDSWRTRSGRRARRAASSLLRLRELLEDARAYGRERGRLRARADAARSCEPARPRGAAAGARGQAAADAWRSTAPADIQAALDLAREFRLQADHARRRRGVESRGRARGRARCRCSTGAMNNIPSSFDTLGARQENAALLAQGRRAGRRRRRRRRRRDLQRPQRQAARRQRRRLRHAVGRGAARGHARAGRDLRRRRHASARSRPARRPTSSSGAAIRSSSRPAPSTSSCAAWRRFAPTRQDRAVGSLQASGGRLTPTVNCQRPRTNDQGTSNAQLPTMLGSRHRTCLGVGNWECLGSWQLVVGSCVLVASESRRPAEDRCRCDRCG